MKKITFLLLLTSALLQAQTIYKTVESAILGQTRELKIQLPRDYDKNTTKSYPIILVLDGDYLFAPVAGNVRYYSYWNEIPESIVVGVNQAGFRRTDTSYDDRTSFPTKESTAFYNFLKNELMPHIKRSYRSVDFAVIMGNGPTANFMNYFLFEDQDLFDAFINISPSYAPKMTNRVLNELSAVENELWYYLATGSNDFDPIKKDVLYLKARLSTIKNENLHAYFDNFQGKNHYSLVAHAVPEALEKIFLPYGPIGIDEYEEKVLETGSYCDYLLNKYETIEDLYGLAPKIRTNDFMAIAAAIEKNEKWDEYKDLSKIAGKNNPMTMLEYYFEARFYEETGKPKKALRSYRKAYTKKQISFLTENLILDRINGLKADFGY